MLTEGDVEAVAERVVTEIKSVLLKELGKLLWDAIRKAVIGWGLGLFALQQIYGWFK